MKTCREIQNGLSAFLDGEVTPAERAEIEAHLRNCAPCRQQWSELQALAAGLSALPGAVPTPRFLAEVRARLRGGEEVEPKPSWADALFRPYWLKVPLEAVALMVVLATAAFLLGPGSQPRSLELAKATEEPTLSYPSSPAAPGVSDGKREEQHAVTGDELAMKRKTEPTGPVAAETLERQVAAGDLPAADAKALARDRVLDKDARVVPFPSAIPVPPTPARGIVLAQQLDSPLKAAAAVSRPPTDFIVIEAADFSELQQDVAQMAGALRGRVVVPLQRAKADGRTRNLWVELPAGNVAPFKVQLAAEARRQREAQFGYAASTPTAGVAATGRAAGELGLPSAQPASPATATSEVRRFAEAKAAKPTIHLGNAGTAPAGGSATSVTAVTEAIPMVAESLSDTGGVTVLEIQVVPPRK